MGKGCGALLTILHLVVSRWTDMTGPPPYGCGGFDEEGVGDGNDVDRCCSHRRDFLGCLNLAD